MNRSLALSLVATLLVMQGSAAWASSQYGGSKSNVYKAGTSAGPSTKGFTTSASTTMSGASDSEGVYNVPADPGTFILTEFCSSAVTGGVRLDAADLGFLAQTTDTTLCYTFGGIEIPGGPSGRTITCATTASAPPGTHSCRISGVSVLK